ncbi:MAG: FKBP-type peptidyl-prolyl cis-trans isomerase, partial [Bacteroidia bacterium]|nr:FKBP-type peptidyl-prolyl cis-trans isomerase [Bacteroidia bacterium]
NVLYNGYEYKIYVDEEGNDAKPGQVVTMDYEVIDDFGNVIDDSRKASIRPATQLPKEITPKLRSNPLLSLVSLLSPGDSADVYVPIDSLPNAPQEFRQSKMITYRVKILNVEDPGDFRKRRHKETDDVKSRMARLGDTVGKEAEMVLKAYQEGTLEGRVIEKNQGMKVVVLEEGTTTKPENGELVEIHYFGFFRDGKEFDNSYKTGKTFSFYIGRGGAIEGMMTGVPEIGVGGTALLDIPYELAYGVAGNPPVIPPKSDLIFYVKLDKLYNQK